MASSCEDRNYEVRRQRSRGTLESMAGPPPLKRLAIWIYILKDSPLHVQTHQPNVQRNLKMGMWLVGFPGAQKVNLRSVGVPGGRVNEQKGGDEGVTRVLV